MTRTLRWKDHHGAVLDSARGFDVIACEACGFRHVVPLPTPEEMDRVYRQDYYSREKPLLLDRVREDREWWDMVYAERYAMFERNLPPPRRRILDIGSGPGFFLLQGKQRGWSALGIEPSSRAAAHARGLGVDVVEEFLSRRTAEGLGPFDVVHLSTVIEHLPDPAGILSIARSLLDPGGLVCVVAPNDYNPFQAALVEAEGFSPWWVAPPHHLNFFDFDTLASLLRRVGFDIVEKTASFPIDMFLLMGENYVGNDALGRSCHGRRMRMELTLARAGKGDLMRKIYTSLASLGLGREVILLGRKT